MQLMGGLLNVSICLVLTLGAGVEAWYLLLPALEATQGQIDGFYSQFPYKYHLEDWGLLNVSICLVLTLGAGVEAWYLM